MEKPLASREFFANITRTAETPKAISLETAPGGTGKARYAPSLNPAHPFRNFP
jgi:hypothetical protein